jgi:hypothetical protein
MDINCFPGIYVALLNTNHKCTHPCLCVVQRRTLEGSTSMATRSYGACDPRVRCMWKMKMVSHHHSYRCSCKDLRVYAYECKKYNKSFLYSLSIILWYLTSKSTMCEIMTLAHIWDAFGFLWKNGCDIGQANKQYLDLWDAEQVQLA